MQVSAHSRDRCVVAPARLIVAALERSRWLNRRGERCAVKVGNAGVIALPTIRTAGAIRSREVVQCAKQNPYARA
jgi:hypothetical protein